MKSKFWRSSRFPGQRFTGSKKGRVSAVALHFGKTGDVGLKARSRIGRARLTSAIRGVAGATAVAPVPQAKCGWLSDVRCCSHNGLKSDIASCRVCANFGSGDAHSITSSARSSIDDGISSPSALAVFTLMTSSNFVA